jgi:long-chain acyl-CoA synthetase
MSCPAAEYSLGFDLRYLSVSGAGRTAMVRGGREATFGTLSAAADQVAVALRQAGVCRGDRIFVLSRSGFEVFALVIGAAQLGAVTVPAHWRMSSAELAAVLDDCQAKVVFADPDLRHLLPVARPVVELAPDAGGAGSTAFSQWLGQGGGEPPILPSRPADPVLQIYTSGTSGQPKGVQLTNANLAEKVRRMGQQWRFTASSRSLLATPLFHIGGLSWGLIGLAARAITYLPDRAGPVDLLRSTVTDRITHAFLVPKMLADLTAAAGPGRLPASPVEVIVCGGAPVSAELQLRAMQTFGCSVFQVYGMTETTGAIVELDATQAAAGPGSSALLRSCGTPYPWVEVEIHDPRTLQPLPAEAAGEIWTRSAQNCAGYWNRPAETADLLADGWLRTGDGGYLDADGYLYLTDRIKDMIVSGGENIYSAEVERALLAHPSVAEAAVIGLPDEDWGEIVVAVLVPAAGQHVAAGPIVDHVGQILGRYKRPRRVVVKDALPRNASGKVLKRQLRAELGQVADSAKGRKL